MSEKTLYQYVKLGMNVEFLNGIGTISILLGTSMVAFPNLTMNLPAARYPVRKVIEVIKSIFLQLEELDLQQSLKSAEPLRPMLDEMENFMASVPEQSQMGITLQDPFADQIVALAKNLAFAIRAETSAKLASVKDKEAK